MMFTLSDLVLIMNVCVASICRRITNNLPDQLIFYVTLVMKFFILCIVALLSVVSSLSVCQAGEEALLGEYVKDVENTMDGVAVYSNANDMAFFRNKGFWYLGNLGPWPPETHYRCVEGEGCNYQGEAPPITAEGTVWSASKMFGSEPVPIIVEGACEASNEL